MKTVRLTMAQALVKFLDNQYVEFDGVEQKFVRGIFTLLDTEMFWDWVRRWNRTRF